MDGMTNLRAPGLGLAPAMSNENPTGRRDARLPASETSLRTTFQLQRLFDVFRRVDSEVTPSRQGQAASPSSQPLARA